LGCFYKLACQQVFIFDLKQLPDLKSRSWICLWAVKRPRNNLSSCGNTS